MAFNRLFPYALLLSLLITGCATQPGNNQEDLGQEERKSPADVYVQLGIAYMQDRQYATALKKLRRGLDLDPKHAQLHNVMALLYDRLNEADKATTYFDKAVSLSPRDSYIRNARGTHYCKLGQYVKADMDFNAALKNPLYTTPWVALTNAGLCSLRQEDLKKAEEYFRRALSRNSQYYIALEQMVRINYQQRNYLSARVYLERYLAVQRPSAAVLLLGVRVERELGNKKAMEGYKRQLLELFPDAPEVQQMKHMG